MFREFINDVEIVNVTPFSYEDGKVNVPLSRLDDLGSIRDVIIVNEPDFETELKGLGNEKTRMAFLWNRIRVIRDGVCIDKGLFYYWDVCKGLLKIREDFKEE